MQCSCRNYTRFPKCGYRLMTIPIHGTDQVRVYSDSAFSEHDHSVEKFKRGLPQKCKEAILGIMREDMALKPASVAQKV